MRDSDPVVRNRNSSASDEINNLENGGSFTRFAGHISVALEQSASAISICDFNLAPHFANRAAHSLFGATHVKLRDALHSGSGAPGGGEASAIREIIQRDGVWRGAIVVTPGSSDLPQMVDVEISHFEAPEATGLMVIARVTEERAEATFRLDSEIVKNSPRFSEREKEVVLGLMEGCSNKAIALRIGISPRTVEFHRARLMARFQAKSLVQMLQLIFATEAG